VRTLNSRVPGARPRSLARVAAVTAVTAVTTIALVALSAGASTVPAPPRPATFVASGATKVVVRANRGLNAKVDRYTTVTTTNAVKIASFISKLSALPPAATGIEMCPMDVGATLTLRFYLSRAATPYAKVVADVAGCGLVTIYEYGGSGVLTGIATDLGGVTFSKFVATSLGIKKLQVL